MCRSAPELVALAEGITAHGAEEFTRGGQTPGASHTTVECDAADFPQARTWAVLTALAAGTMTGQSTALMAALLTVWTAMGLLAEWQARRTLVTLARTAPAGLITIRQNTSRGQAFWLVWGSDSDQRRWQSRT